MLVISLDSRHALNQSLEMLNLLSSTQRDRDLLYLVLPDDSVLALQDLHIHMAGQADDED